MDNIEKEKVFYEEMLRGANYEKNKDNLKSINRSIVSQELTLTNLHAELLNF